MIAGKIASVCVDMVRYLCVYVSMHTNSAVAENKIRIIPISVLFVAQASPVQTLNLWLLVERLSNC